MDEGITSQRTPSDSTLENARSEVLSIKEHLRAARDRRLALVRLEVDALTIQLMEAEAEVRALEIEEAVRHHNNRREMGEYAFARICSEFEVSHAELVAQGRTDRVRIARNELMRRLYNEHGWSLKEIGLALGSRNHSTIIHGARSAEKRLSTMGVPFTPRKPRGIGLQ